MAVCTPPEINAPVDAGVASAPGGDDRNIGALEHDPPVWPASDDRQLMPPERQLLEQIAVDRTAVALRSNRCYSAVMAREISVRDLRNHTAEVVAAVRSGERLSLTVNRLPVADIVPHTTARSPWVPASTLRALLHESAADQGLLTDLADVRGSLLDSE